MARDLKGNNDLLVLTRPEIVREIHSQYVAAGADIIETNTFSGTTIAQADYGMGDFVPEINEAAARVARSAADACTDRRVFVAGAIGPLNRTLSISRDVNDPGKREVTFVEVAAAYRQQVEHLIEAGVDILLVETIFDTLNAKAALFAIADYFEASGRRLPVMVSGTITDLSGRTLTGQTVEAFLNSVSHFPLLSIGLNCALGPAEMRPYIEELSAKAPFFVSTYPNAGLPDPLCQRAFLKRRKLLRHSSTTGHNRAGSILWGDAAERPRSTFVCWRMRCAVSRRGVLPERSRTLRLSGLEAFTARAGDSNFVNIGERTNVTGSPKFRQADPGGQLRRGTGGGAPAGRRQAPRSST